MPAVAVLLHHRTHSQVSCRRACHSLRRLSSGSTLPGSTLARWCKMEANSASTRTLDQRASVQGRVGWSAAERGGSDDVDRPGALAVDRGAQRKSPATAGSIRIQYGGADLIHFPHPSAHHAILRRSGRSSSTVASERGHLRFGSASRGSNPEPDANPERGYMYVQHHTPTDTVPRERASEAVARSRADVSTAGT